jgi:hypothetical protein
MPQLSCKRLHDNWGKHLSGVLFFLDIIVVNLDGENNQAACRRNQVGDEQRPEYVWLMKHSLKHETGTADTHHQEGRQSDTIGVAGTNGVDSLRQITQNHRYACQPTTNFVKKTLFHIKNYFANNYHFFSLIRPTQQAPMTSKTPATIIMLD